MSTHTVVRRSSDLKVLSTVIQCLHVHSLRIKYSSSLATNQASHQWYGINKMRSGSDVSYWMWSRRERGAILEVGRVREIDELTSVGINCRETSAKSGSELFVACILVQRHEAAIQEGVMKLHVCFVSSAKLPFLLFLY